MAILSDLQSTCLAGVLSVWDKQEVARSRMDELLTKLTDNHFAGDYYQVWKIVAKVYPEVGGVPDPSAVINLIDTNMALGLPVKVQLREQLNELAAREVSDIQFKVSVLHLGEFYRDNNWQDTLEQALSILNGTVNINREAWAGYEDSKSFLLERLTDSEHATYPMQELEGDINDDAVDILTEYAAAKHGDSKGILTGIGDLDLVTGGMFPGDVILLAGYTSEGKSKLAVNVAYNACYEQGKNVLFGTNEATRKQVRLGLVVRHSHNTRFQGLEPLRYSAVKWGSLTPDGETMLKTVVSDMRKVEDDNGQRRHGRLNVFQMPSHASASYLRETVRRYARSFQPDLLVVDYLGLLGSSKRLQRREELDDLLVQAKRMAVELQIPLVSPWQISRKAWEDARDSSLKQYTKASLSDTSQAEKTSDVIMTVLRLDEPNKIKCQILKNRDGEAGAEFELYVDFASSLVRSNDQLGSILDL